VGREPRARAHPKKLNLHEYKNQPESLTASARRRRSSRTIVDRYVDPYLLAAYRLGRGLGTVALRRRSAAGRKRKGTHQSSSSK
jgi:hypothetical protein